MVLCERFRFSTAIGAPMIKHQQNFLPLCWRKISNRRASFARALDLLIGVHFFWMILKPLRDQCFDTLRIVQAPLTILCQLGVSILQIPLTIIHMPSLRMLCSFGASVLARLFNIGMIGDAFFGTRAFFAPPTIATFHGAVFREHCKRFFGLAFTTSLCFHSNNCNIVGTE